MSRFDFRLIPTYIYSDAVVYRAGMGDILFWQGEFVAPLENPDEILSVHRLSLDDLGFRLPAHPTETYTVVALGDSFTEGANVALPWPDIFAEKSGLSTRNFGFRGYGPQHYAWVMENFAVEEAPEIVILGFFGANDLATAGLQELPPFILPREERLLELPAANELRRNAEAGANYRYPVQTTTGHSLAFLSTYISWMNLPEELLLQSVNYEVIAESLNRIQAAAPEACLVLAYLPSKAEVYLPYLEESAYPRVLAGQQHVLINSDGTLHILEDPDLSLEEILRNQHSLPHALAQVARENNFHFLNLWEAFDGAAEDGVMLYYAYDTHWNQAGHDLAGAAIADYIAANCSER